MPHVSSVGSGCDALAAGGPPGVVCCPFVPVTPQHPVLRKSQRRGLGTHVHVGVQGSVAGPLPRAGPRARGQREQDSWPSSQQASRATAQGQARALTTLFLSVQFSRASLSSPACLAQEKTVSTALSPGSCRTLWVELGRIMPARGRQSFLRLRIVYPVQTKGSERFSLAGAPAFSVCVSWQVSGAVGEGTSWLSWWQSLESALIFPARKDPGWNSWTLLPCVCPAHCHPRTWLSAPQCTLAQRVTWASFPSPW